MNLVFEFNDFGNSNYCMASIFRKIYDNFQNYYPQVNKTWENKNTKWPICNAQGSRCGCHSMNIINYENNKVVVVNFWDRGMDFKDKWPEWEDLNVVNIFGGLGFNVSKEKFYETYKIKYTPFLYPLANPQCYADIEKIREPYIHEKKIKKACFIGTLYSARENIVKHLKNHPLIEIYTQEDGYRGESFYKKMNEYALTLSLNGNGEYSVREFESMGLGIPIVRSELITPLMKELVPNVNYIRGSQPSMDGGFGYTQILKNSLDDYKIIADEFIDSIEKCINNEELLTTISKNNLEYFNEYLLEDKIVNHFFSTFELSDIK